MHLRKFLSSTWDHVQDNLFPWLREELAPLTDLHKRATWFGILALTCDQLLRLIV